MDEIDKLKNLLDLDYSNNLTKLNISIVIIATFIIASFLTKFIPLGIPKSTLILLLATLMFVYISYFNNKLKRIRKEIENLDVSGQIH